MTDIDDIRLLTGDTILGDRLLDDDEYQALIDRRQMETSAGTATNIYAAAADACSAIAGKFARDYDFTTDGQTFNRGQRIGHYMNLEREYRSQSGGVAVPISGDSTTT